MLSSKQALFIIGEEEYGLDIVDIMTIEKLIVIEPAANLTKNIKGTINLRGDVIPVYSLRSKFGLEEIPSNSKTRLVITNSNDMEIAYEVDQVRGITNLEQEQVNEIPSIIQSQNTGYIKQVANVDGRLIVLLDHDGILSEEDQDCARKLFKKK